MKKHRKSAPAAPAPRFSDALGIAIVLFLLAFIFASMKYVLSDAYLTGRLSTPLVLECGLVLAAAIVASAGVTILKKRLNA